MNISGLAPIIGMNIGEAPPETGNNLYLAPRVPGPRRLLLDMLKQDPSMAEILKKLKLKGEIDNGSMGPDYAEQGQR